MGSLTGLEWQLNRETILLILLQLSKQKFKIMPGPVCVSKRFECVFLIFIWL